MNLPKTWKTAYIARKKFFIWGISVLAAIYFFTPVALVQFLSLFFLFILIGSKFYSEYLIKNIRVIRGDSELRTFKHEWIRVELKIENRGLLPAFMLVANDLPGKFHIFRMSKTFCTLAGRSWTLFYWEAYCTNRGLFNAGPAIVRGSDPLGLFPFRLTAEETTNIYVYPVLRSISIKPSGGIPLGNMICANPLFEDITRSRSLRPYNPGDEPRRINWKISAHVAGVTRTGSGSLLVNEYEATASYPLMIFLNMNKKEYPFKKQNDFIERTIEAAAALCLRASAQRQELGIIFYKSGRNGVSVIAQSSNTLLPILERLAVIDWSDSADYDSSDQGSLPLQSTFAHNSAMVMLEHGKRLPYGTRYVYTGCNLNDEEYISLNSLKKNNIRLEYIIIDEKTMPSIVPGKSPRYQMKEIGYEII